VEPTYSYKILILNIHSVFSSKIYLSSIIDLKLIITILLQNSVCKGGGVCKDEMSVSGGSRKNLDLKLTLTIFLRKNICEFHKITNKAIFQKNNPFMLRRLSGYEKKDYSYFSINHKIFLTVRTIIMYL
jgi:hypothetical protein